MVILFNPWSTSVVISWRDSDVDLILEIPTPKSTSRLYLLIVSLVILLLTSLTTTSPIKLGEANDFASGGSEWGLSLFVWGNSSFTGWEKSSLVKGATVGALEELSKVR